MDFNTDKWFLVIHLSVGQVDFLTKFEPYVYTMIFIVNCNTGCTKCYCAEMHCRVSVVCRQRMEQSSLNRQLLVQLVTTPHLPLLHIQAKEHQGKCMLENTIKYADYQNLVHLMCVLHYYIGCLGVVHNYRHL